MALEQTSQVKEKTKLGYDQIQQATAESKSSSFSSGSQGKEGRTDINRTSESVQSGSKESVSSGENASERQANTQTQVARNSIERANIGFTLTFTIPLTGIIPTTQGSNC